MGLKWCTKLDILYKRCPIVFQGHPSNFKVTGADKLTIWIQFEISRSVAAIKTLRFALLYEVKLREQATTWVWCHVCPLLVSWVPMFSWKAGWGCDVMPGLGALRRGWVRVSGLPTALDPCLIYVSSDEGMAAGGGTSLVFLALVSGCLDGWVRSQTQSCVGSSCPVGFIIKLHS